MEQVKLYDTTLRDGMGGPGMSLSVEEKLKVVEALDRLGVQFIEAGFPSSNPKEAELFERLEGVELEQGTIVAFGMTRRRDVEAADDEALRTIVRCFAPVVCLVGKSWGLHLEKVIRVSPDENLAMIADSVRFCREQGKRVVFDAEHFFDGFKADPERGLQCLRAAAEAGADVLVLCDTRGGSMPSEIVPAVQAALKVHPRLGIHCHNDCELAVANSLAAVGAGAEQVQGTINGFGERCGNANLCSVIPNLQLKLGLECVSAEQLKKLLRLSHTVYELANMEPYKRQAYVGQSAFAHKGGLHVAAVQKNRETYEHIEPEKVGNRQRVLVSDLAGRSSVVYKAKQFGLDLDGGSPAVKQVLEKLKQLESVGFQYEGAEASFELLMQEALKGKVQHFRLVSYSVSDAKAGASDAPSSEAVVMIEGPDGASVHTVARGNGPLNALDRALRKALTPYFPQLSGLELHDYKVRVLGGADGTDATVRVLIESGDNRGDEWGTVGVSPNVIDASWQALVDSIEYKLYKDEKDNAKAARTEDAVRTTKS
jgi:2-isopropylmalate synthase